MNPKIYSSKCFSCYCWSSMHEQQKLFTCWCYTINFSAFAGGKLGRLDASEVSISSTCPLFRFLFTGTVLNGSSSAVSLAIFSLELSAMLFSHVCRRVSQEVARVSQSNISFPVLDQSRSKWFCTPTIPTLLIFIFTVLGEPRLPFQDNKITNRFDH